MRDPRIEQLLADGRYAFRYEEAIPLKNIRVDDAALQNIRIGSQLDEDYVVRYALAWEEGKRPPALVLTPYDEKLLHRVLDGLHRLAALGLVKHPPLTIDAYVVETTSEREHNVLRHILNAGLNGASIGGDQALLHALDLIELGVPAVEAARLMGLKQGTVENQQRVNQILGRLARFGLARKDVLGEGRLGKAHLLAAGTIQRDQDLNEVVRLALEYNLTAEDTRTLATKVRGAENDAAVRAYLDKWRVERADIAKQRQRDQTAPEDRDLRIFRRLPNRCDGFLQAINERVVAKGVRAADVKALEATLNALKRTDKRIHAAIADLRQRVEVLRGGKTAA